MENYFTKKMAATSDSELRYIIDNKENFQEEAYVAAIEELEKRELATEELSHEKQEIIERITEQQQAAEQADEEKKVERKKDLKELIGLFKPSKNYLYTPIIVYLNILVFILMTISGVHPVEPSVESLIVWGGNLRDITLGGQPWRLLTNIFLHGGLFHLLLNIYALLLIGGILESKFSKNRYLFAYIATGLIASMASISFNDNIVSIGASGAIFGMYGLFLALLILKVLDIPKESANNLILSILFFLGYNLFYGFTKEGIDNAAHIGGLISGFIIGFAYFPCFRQPKYSRFITVGLSVILLASVLIMPKVYGSKLSEFQATMKDFGMIEEKALWMYHEDLSDISEDNLQYYYDRLRNEGIDLWKNNLELLSTLTDLPPYLQEIVDLLTQYCELRMQSCEAMQYILRYNRSSDLAKIENINQRIEKILSDLQELNE